MLLPACVTWSVAEYPSRRVSVFPGVGSPIVVFREF